MRPDLVPPTRAVLAVAAAAALLAAGCSSGSGDHPAAPGSAPARTASVAPPAGSPPAGPAAPGPAANPLTGLGPRPRGPVLAVKVDNAPSARPLQQGLSRAAVVYQELVEGGATRYMAIFVGRGRFLVGPCRSARLTDLQILRAYGRVVLGFSGANRHVLAAVHRAPLVDVSQYEHPGAYETHGRRPEAWNFFTSPHALAAVAGRRATGVRDVGFRFGGLTGGRPAAGGAVAFTPYSRASWRWDAARHGWRLAQDGRPMDLADGTSVVPANIVVEYVRVTRGAYHDVLGNNSPDSATVGSGPAAIFRDGRVVRVRWSRRDAAAPTRLLGASGRDVPLHPGRTWVLLVPRGHRLSVG